MTWHALLSLQPSLPGHCKPETEFLNNFSSTFHTCVPTDLAFISTLLGTLSIVSWLFAQLPQIYKNYSLKSTSGLSIFFLVEWCLGDLTNLLGAIFTHQASWQLIVAGYYCFVDSMLVIQWLWYEKLKHGYTIRRVWPRKQGHGRDAAQEGDMQQMVIEGMPALSQQNSGDDAERTANSDSKSQAKDIKTGRSGQAAVWRMPNFIQTDEHGDEKDMGSPTQSGRTIYRTQASASLPSPSPRTVIMIACLVSLATASPIQHAAPLEAISDGLTPLETAGSILSWISTLLYLGSRLPQIYKNWSRQSTAGLSPGLFVAAFFGNMFYSTSIATDPNAWSSCGPYGNNGWAGSDGNDRYDWVMSALPFWLGAAGVLALDAAVGVQFLIYGDGGDAAKVVVLEEADNNGRWRWRRVSGWMRGWVPNFNEHGKMASDQDEEREGLLTDDRRGDYTYGTSGASAA